MVGEVLVLRLMDVDDVLVSLCVWVKKRMVMVVMV